MSESSKIREGGKAARKAQAKRRAAAETAPPAGMHTGLNPSLDSSAEPHDSAGIADDKSSR
jgi:hypothetical protein